MKKIRIIARLDIKGPNVVKGIHLEGIRVVGNPNKFAKDYSEDGADELICMDVVASLYGRNNLNDVIEDTAKNVFIPVTVGGGIRSVEDIYKLLRSGADKVSINTAAIKDPSLITKAAHTFGSQCVVLSVEAKNKGNFWEAYTDSGREKTGVDVIEWIQEAVKLGAGEILLTSVDKDGTKSGFDIELVKEVSDKVDVPIIVSGGFGSTKDIIECLEKTSVDSFAIGTALHYGITNIKKIKTEMKDSGYVVRLD